MVDILVVDVDVLMVDQCLQYLHPVCRNRSLLQVRVNLSEAIEEGRPTVFIEEVNFDIVVKQDFAQLWRGVEVGAVVNDVVETCSFLQVFEVGICPNLQYTFDVFKCHPAL